MPPPEVAALDSITDEDLTGFSVDEFHPKLLDPPGIHRYECRVCLNTPASPSMAALGGTCPVCCSTVWEAV